MDLRTANSSEHLSGEHPDHPRGKSFVTANASEAFKAAAGTKKARNFSEMFGDAAVQTARLQLERSVAAKNATSDSNSTVALEKEKQKFGSTTDESNHRRQSDMNTVVARKTPAGATLVLTRKSSNNKNSIQVSDARVSSSSSVSNNHVSTTKPYAFVTNETTVVPASKLVRRSLTDMTSKALRTQMDQENAHLAKSSTETMLVSVTDPAPTSDQPAALPDLTVEPPAPVPQAPNKPVKSSLRTLFGEKKRVSFSDLTESLDEKPFDSSGLDTTDKPVNSFPSLSGATHPVDQPMLHEASSSPVTTSPPVTSSATPPAPLDTSKRPSSRLLDDSKRKEFWMDFKKAEEVAGDPQRRHSLTDTDEDSGSSRRESTVGPLLSSTNSAYGSGNGGGSQSDSSRLDHLLLNLQNELTSLRAEKARSMSLYPGSTNKMTSPILRESSVPDISHASRSTTTGSASLPSTPSNSHKNRSQSMFYGGGAPSASSPNAVKVGQEDGDDKSKIEAELERRSRIAANDKEMIRSLQQRLQLLENVQRENQFLKEEHQKNIMQELSGQELLKTLREKLALTEKSEDQLKLQTKQLMQQNQSLQADLLEKIASETARIQKIAYLNAEKQRLTEEMQKLEVASTKKEASYRKEVNLRILAAVLARKERVFMKHAMAKWKVFNARVLYQHGLGLEKLCQVLKRHRSRQMVLAWHRLRSNLLVHNFEHAQARLKSSIQQAHQAKRFMGIQALCLHLNGMTRRVQSFQLRKSFEVLKQTGRQNKVAKSRIAQGIAKWESVMRNKRQWDKAKGFLIWKFFVDSEFMRHHISDRDQLEKQLGDAKEYIVTLTKAKARAEEKVDEMQDDKNELLEQIDENKNELRMAKHGFVVVHCLQAQEKQFLRGFFQEWKLFTQLQLQDKEFQHQARVFELQLEDKEKYAASLDDYNRVLRNDLERYQFFSQDKRITVDVLTKKILREEERYKQMEEKHVVLEEKVLTLRDQIASLVEWEGIDLPLPLLSLSKDLALSKIRELFVLHADPVSTGNGAQGRSENSSPTHEPTSHEPVAAESYRMPFESLVRMINLSPTSSANSLEIQHKEIMLEKLHRHFPEAVERGIYFTDFIAGMGNFLNDVFEDAPDRTLQIKTFWKSLFNLFLSSSTSNRSCKNKTAEFGAVVGSPKSSWAGKLSDDILQNQEKLLAVLEHETAVVERAVMEKGASLKHTYLPSDSMDSYGYGSASETSPPSSMVAPFSPNSAAELISNQTEWLDLAQVRDVFMAHQAPILHTFAKHNNESKRLRFTNLVDVLLEMNLLPHVVSKEKAYVFFQRLKDIDEQVDFNNFLRFLGLCALQLHEHSLMMGISSSNCELSIREILACFFAKVGYTTATSNGQPCASTRQTIKCICVGVEVESILWPLFEYYASFNDSKDPNDKRIAMNVNSFLRFMSEIAHDTECSYQTCESICRRVMEVESFQEVSSPLTMWQMHFDSFYQAIAMMQQERNPLVTYCDDGEAVRHWMHETQ